MRSAQKFEGDAAQNTDSIYLFPLSFYDELHASQAARYHVVSGNRNTSTSFQQLYDARPFRNTLWIPQHLERFARKLPGSATANVESLLRSNTLFPLFETFGNVSLALSDTAKPISQQIRNMPKRIVGESGKISLCFDCLRGDLVEHGTPYIHRSHQIPGVDVCWKHGTRLLTNCPLCGCPFERTERPDLVLAPWAPCLCGQHLPDTNFWAPEIEDNSIARDFSKFARDVLTAPTRPLSGAMLARLYKQRLVELGLKRKGLVDWKSASAAIEEHFGRDFLARIEVAYRKGRITPWFTLVSEYSIFDAHIGRHLLLAHFLFRQADKFWKATSTVPLEITSLEPKRPTISVVAPNIGIDKETAHPSRNSRNPRPIVSDESLTPEKRDITRLLESHQDWRLNDFWREHPGLMRNFLRKNDDALAWLTKSLLPSSSSNTPQRLAEQQVNADDAKWAEIFWEAARAEFISKARPTKATRNYLMRTAKWKARQPPAPQQYPLARQALETLTESNWHYYARRILWAKLTIGVAATAPSSIIIPSGIEHHRGKDLVAYFSDVAVSHPFEPGTIMGILEERGITKAWEGLPPNPKYSFPGRKYVPQYRK